MPASLNSRGAARLLLTENNDGWRSSANERSRWLVPRTGFEPVISTLKGWRPRPLDERGMHRQYT